MKHDTVVQVVLCDIDEAMVAAMKAGIQNFIEAQFHALGDWFSWTWKMGASQVSGNIEASLCQSYQLGHPNGWILTDPRVASAPSPPRQILLRVFTMANRNTTPSLPHPPRLSPGLRRR
ncbi:uncharacterized protein LACBIDRAFT_298855 [Laccaria bicolor S238N-H82]|uniref:Predicted protein n=1 Tax=Laccaria bicolor (strain S238N-H82 / ATCC MYA-4686) TaxID=486041 RepID=B0DE63_LACBS|nr:uncharacterized protein LACBIDRAFT_298855 [Laccaria bicolor S238N-H82]EDR07209.1 predicted protein [Laccaria bicolor S238N-H82]|eukprot:XP_001882140.1 predicted protein [Laccaria bicolor S238N-H82]